MKTFKPILAVFTFLALCICFDCSAARNSHQMQAISTCAECVLTSPNFRTIVTYDGRPKKDRFVILRYDDEAGEFKETGFLSDYNNRICEITDSGEVSLLEYSYTKPDHTLLTYASDGSLIRSVDARDCPNGEMVDFPYVDPQEAALSVDFRTTLCTIPNSALAQFPHGDSTRIRDIKSVKAVFPNGAILAEVMFRQATANNAKFAGYESHTGVALIKAGKSRENYCLNVSIRNAQSDPSCDLTRDKTYSSPFLSRYYTGYNYGAGESLSDSCTFQVTLKNQTRHSTKDLKVRAAADWLNSEYDGVVLADRFTTKLSSGSTNNHFLTVGKQGCGYVIRFSTADPKLRIESVGIGDLWCSHY